MAESSIPIAANTKPKSLAKPLILIGTIGVIAYIVYKKGWLSGIVQNTTDSQSSGQPYYPGAFPLGATPDLTSPPAAAAPTAPQTPSPSNADMQAYANNADFLWNKVDRTKSVNDAIRRRWLASQEFKDAIALASNLSFQEKIDTLGNSFTDYVLFNYGRTAYNNLGIGRTTGKPNMTLTQGGKTYCVVTKLANGLWGKKITQRIDPQTGKIVFL
jgi:hypothetical protein